MRGRFLAGKPLYVAPAERKEQRRSRLEVLHRSKHDAHAGDGLRVEGVRTDHAAVAPQGGGEGHETGRGRACPEALRGQPRSQEAALSGGVQPASRSLVGAGQDNAIVADSAGARPPGAAPTLEFNNPELPRVLVDLALGWRAAECTAEWARALPGRVVVADEAELWLGLKRLAELGMGPFECSPEGQEQRLLHRLQQAHALLARELLLRGSVPPAAAGAVLVGGTAELFVPGMYCTHLPPRPPPPPVSAPPPQGRERGRPLLGGRHRRTDRAV
eukprot:TRINITY_DN10352_c0_g1_i5.p3 TRINITY_DN10352_c0_g1~~TRINITY_DN10352_c0_g1_i5.p3  ORF type:complete len:274 (+),score=48.32 TRINITY_DN10352_c0_g1_i5:255-1076(+)